MKRDAIKIRASARRMGYDAEIEESQLSESCYILLSWGDARLFKVRVSDHESRPTYLLSRGEAAFEVGNHQDADGNADDAIAWLRDRIPEMQAESERWIADRKARFEKDELAKKIDPDAFNFNHAMSYAERTDRQAAARRAVSASAAEIHN